jgi:hypothetical protein
LICGKFHPLNFLHFPVIQTVGLINHPNLQKTDRKITFHKTFQKKVGKLNKMFTELQEFSLWIFSIFRQRN